MMLTGNFDKRSLTASLYYYRKKGLIRSPRAGIYTKNEYNPEEMACAVFSDSYISLQYVLAKSGVVFQYSEKITCISCLSRELTIDGRDYLYRRIAPELWASRDGIIQKDGYCIATPERALVDTMYLYPGIRYFDRLDGLDRELVMRYGEELSNKRLLNRLLKLFGYR